ncbi:MAG: divergent polysaccharide deacetylase family protein [Actinobacteria bacterium]|nr:divergent polysaccharide deacetylase family protein [Actinomycetota bacterium]MBU4489369.1 divergent polysaccharide deacetylase family protein [Actinomycetota bacterium]
MTYECEWARSKGFYVVDSNSARNSKVAQAAVSLGLGHKRNEVFIDHQNDPDYIRSAMRKLADLATKNGYAIGICHFNRPNTAAVVGEMVKVLKEEGLFAFARDIDN